MESLCFPVVVTTRPQGTCDPVLPLSKGRGRNGKEAIVSGWVSKVVDPDVKRDIDMEPEILPVVISTESIVSGRVSKVVDPDVRRGIQMEPEILPVVLSTDDVEPMAVPVVALTRSRVERPLVVARPVDEILSRRESNVGMSDVSCDICMEPDLLPVVMFTDEVEPLAVPMVALTRSQVERPLVVARPVDEIISGRESNIGMSDVSRDICMSRDLDEIQQHQMGGVLLRYVDLFSTSGSTLTGHTDAVEQEIDTGDGEPIRCAPRRM